MTEWTKEERKESEWNNKRLYAIIRAFIPDEYPRIWSFHTSKEAWDIVKTMHEGIFTVKR